MTTDAVTSNIEGKFFKVYIYGQLHLSFYIDNYIAMQAWVEGPSWWCVNIYLENLDEPLLLEYDNEERWKAVVALLNEHL